jgi:hypothetical protein
MLCFWDRMDAGRFRAALVAGMMAAFAAWTKNEGVLFFIVALIVFCALNIRAITSESSAERAAMRTDSFARMTCGLRGPRAFLSHLAPFLIGSLPILLVVSCFKAQLPTSGHMLAAQDLATLAAKVTDISRYWLILRAYLEWTLKFGRGAIVILITYVLLVGRDTGVRSKALTVMPASLLLLMLLGYFVAYLITPYDLAWHVSLSIDRLFLQLWPSAIFAAFMVARTPEQMLAKTAPIGSEAL